MSSFWHPAIQPGEETSDIQLTKVDDSGDVVWSKTIDFLTFDDPQSIIKAPDGGNLVVGITECDIYHPQLFLLKLDEDGNSCMDEEEQFVGYYEPEIVTETPYSTPSVSATAPIGEASTVVKIFGAEGVDFCAPEELKFDSKKITSLPLVDYCESSVLTIVEPQNFESHPYEPPTYVSTDYIDFSVSSTDPEIDTYKLKLNLEYRTSGDDCDSCNNLFEEDDISIGSTYQKAYESMGGKVTVDAEKFYSGTTYSAPSKTMFVFGWAIPKSSITSKLLSLYTDGETPNLYTGIAMRESRYRHFCHRSISGYECVWNQPRPYGLYAFWPHEAQDNATQGGSHIGLMQVATTMERAWNWITNAEKGDDVFRDSLQLATNKMNNRIAEHPPNALRVLSDLELEKWAVCLYGPKGFVNDNSKQYWVPVENQGSWDWQLNTSQNSAGVQYVADVYDLRKN